MGHWAINILIIKGKKKGTAHWTMRIPVFPFSGGLLACNPAGCHAWTPGHIHAGCLASGLTACCLCLDCVPQAHRLSNDSKRPVTPYGAYLQTPNTATVCPICVCALIPPPGPVLRCRHVDSVPVFQFHLVIHRHGPIPSNCAWRFVKPFSININITVLILFLLKYYYCEHLFLKSSLRWHIRGGG